MRLGVSVEGSMFPLDQQHRVVDVARMADAAGVDYLSLPEHVLVGSNANAQDPWSAWEPHHLDMPWTEPLLTLAAMSSVTSRIRLVSGVVIAPLRPAGLLAKMGASLHVLSQGRFVMGVSPSWHKDEYDALGVAFERRGQLLEDSIGACRALWEGAPASFHSPTVNFDGMFCSPRPQPNERIPVWFTGKFTPRLVRRVVALGDGWMPYGAYRMTLEQKAEAIQALRARWAEANRDPTALDICDALPSVEGSIARTMEQAPAMAAAGITIARVHLRAFARTPEQLADVLHEVVERFKAYA